MAETKGHAVWKDCEMKVTISNEIYVKEPSRELIQWARENLVILNPEFAKRQRMGLWTGKTEKQLYFFYVDGDMLALSLIHI